MQILIPFDGFYYSITDSFIDSEIETQREYRLEEEEPEFTDFDVDFKGIAIEYVKYLCEYLESEHDLTINLTFSELVSPREYNFTTDRIFCDISEEDTIKLYQWAIDNKGMQKAIDYKFKSRDGFISFYGDFVREWETKEITEWDANELSVLFPEIDYSGVWTNGNGYECFNEHITYIEEEENV